MIPNIFSIPIASVEAQEFSSLERYMVRRFHPRRIFVDMASLPWVVYLIWQHEWQWALILGVLSAFIGAFATRTVNVERYGRTLFGRMALLHLRPMNVVLQILGIAGIVWAIWAHYTPGILASWSLLSVGHLAGWDRVLDLEQSLFSQKSAA